MDMKYVAVFEASEDGTWDGYTPDLPILVNGQSREEAEDRMREAIAIYVDEMKANGFAIPAPAAHVISVDIAA
jgi:predicted RNase H-like HicB family nuclease